MHPEWIVPDGLPAGVGAIMTTRAGGISAPPWGPMNVGSAVGDRDADVRHNRALVAEAAGAEPAWLRQVHGVRVLTLPAAEPPDEPHEADASVTTAFGIACAVQVADCLPVLLACADGRAVAAAHAGWRGLAGGVVDAALAALCDAGGCTPGDVYAWLGPCIGPRRFEVGADVVAAFGAGDSPRFVPAPPRDGVPKWRADLPGLARDRLHALGVTRVAGGGWCTVEDARFHSYRRDGVTGRMAAAIWRVKGRSG